MTSRQGGSTEQQRRGEIPEGQFLPPFLLGFAVALLLVFIPTTCGFFYCCGDVDFTIGEESTCPRLIRKLPQEAKQGLLKRLGLRLKKQEKKDELLVLKPDPRESACRIIAGGWSSIWKRNENAESVCTPEIIDEDVNDEIPATSTTIAHDQFETAYTSEYPQLTTEQKQLILGLGQRVDAKVENWRARASQVSWSGPSGPAWFAPSKSTGASELERLEGGVLFYSYLRIMNWPTQFFSHFPFKLCAKGCGSEVAVEHTLEFREKFKPWAVSPSTIKENSHGCIFHHGFSPAYSADQNGAHSLVWIRPGRRVKLDDLFSLRMYVNALEQSIAASLANSKGRVGKFNVILDGAKFSWGLMPSLHHLKSFVTILQDHFPDRLGIILLTNLGRIGDFVVGVVKPLISEEVRQKIKVLPRDDNQRREMLQAVVGANNIPKWLGGKDTYQFNAKTYYADTLVVPDDESIEYVQTMPYHA